MSTKTYNYLVILFFLTIIFGSSIPGKNIPSSYIFSKDKLLKALTTFSRGGHNPDVQTGTDPERVEEAIKRYEHVYCELEQGDILFFHSNILHASSANKSKFHRWLLICTYNRFDNEPYKKDCDGTPYSTLHKIAPNDILKIARSEMPTV